MNQCALIGITFVALATGLSGATTHLLVDDFDTAFDWQSVWMSDLTSLGISAEMITSAEADGARLAQADVVMWNCGNERVDTLTQSERDALDAFLEGGGRLLLIAPAAPAELIAQGLRDWLMNRLGCDYVMPDSSITWGTIYAGLTLEGEEGSPLSGLEFGLTFGDDADVSAQHLNLVRETDERSQRLVSFQEIPGHLGIARETSRDRTMLLTFALESVDSGATRREILGGCLDWLDRPRLEGRGIWVVANQLTSPESIDDFVEGSAEAGFNALFVQVRSRGDAYYSSATEPRASALSGQPLSFDPLQHCIDAAHARGLQVHAWVNMGFTWGQGALPTDPDHILVRHPEWVMVNRAGKSMLDYTSGEFTAQYAEGRYLSLAAPAVKDYLAGVCLEIVENYSVDGIHFDFIRYPARGVDPDWDLDYNPLTIAAFQSEHTIDPLSAEIDAADFMTWTRWQREQIGLLVGQIRNECHTVRPGIRVSAAVLSRYHLGRHQAAQDWISWLRSGQIDTACLMSYSADNDLVVQETLLAQEGRGERTIWTGMGASDDIELIIDRIEDVRRRAQPEGVMFFAWGSFDSAERSELLTRPFVDPAEVPVVSGGSSSLLLR